MLDLFVEIISSYRFSYSYLLVRQDEFVGLDEVN